MSFADRWEGVRLLCSKGLRRTSVRYEFAVLLVGAATALELGLFRIGPFHQAFILFYPTVVIVAMYAGFGPGILATALAATSAGYFFVEPRYTFVVRTAEDVVGPALFAVIGVSLTVLTYSRTQARQALRVSEDELNRAQSVAHTGSWHFDIALGTIRLSDEAYRILGLTPPLPVSLQQARNIVHPDDLDRVEQAWKNAIATGDYDEENRVSVRDQTRWVRTRARVEYGPNRLPAKAVGTIQDITERKRLQGYEKTIERLQETVVLVDRDYRYILANRAFLQSRRLEREQVIGHPLAELMGIELFETTIKPKLDECFQGATAHFEKRADVPALGIRDFSVTYFPLVGPHGIESVAIVMQDITEKRQAEHSLRASEDRFRDLVEHSEDLVCTHDLEGRLLSVNPTPARILGYSVEELLKIPMRDLIIPEGRPAFDQYLERLRKGSTFETGLLCVLTRNGDWRTWEYRNTLRTEGVPTPIVRGMAHDITEQRRAELALKESEERLRLAQEVAQIGTFDRNLVTGDGRWTPQMEAMYGLAPGAFPRTIEQFIALVHPDDRHGVSELVKKSMASGEAQGEWRVQWPDGSVHWITGHWQVLKDGEGKPLRAIGIDYDITERKLAEEALSKSEEQYRMLVEQASDAIGLADADNNWIDVNSAWSAMIGFTREEVLSQTVGANIDETERGRVLHSAALLAPGETVRFELTLQRKDGALIPIEASAKRLPDGRLQVICRDVSERKRAQDVIRLNEERFRLALKDSPITVFNQDRDLRYTWLYNPCFISAAEAVGKTDDEIIGKKEAEQLNELKRRVLKTERAERTEVTLSYGNSKRAYDVTVEALVDVHGSVVGITGTYVDVARLRELADGLRHDKDRLEREKSYLENEIQTELGFEEIIGQSTPLREVLKKARVVAPTDSTVLLLGATGTGKELVARAIHSLSARRDKNFIKLNCAAVPLGLLESELFGHEKGAFTSAVSQKIGRMELADGGTLFLDEVGELPLELQPKLLRVLQDREFERLGGVRTIRVDVRIISATNRDLQKDVEEGEFREDLFYRLNVFPIDLPGLRQRRSDIPLLVRHFVEKYATRMGRRIESIPSDTMEVLQNWTWPGNVRELENMIERMVILTKGTVLAPPPAELTIPEEIAEASLTEMEREHIIRILRDTNGVLSGADGAASRLGMKRTTLQSMLKRLGIEPQDFRRGNGTFGRE